MKLPPPYEAALFRALHSKEGAAARWGATMRPDDETLRRRIAEEFGIQGGFSVTGGYLDYWGGANPRIAIRNGDGSTFVLSGRELLAAAREALKLSCPGELF